jgi:hypothetical protein
MMILFVAPNPHKVNEKEGFLQRVLAIDDIFPMEEKIYSEDLKNPEELARAIIDADLIYVHSIYNANKILPAYSIFPDKIITDLHGVVPEEEKKADNNEMANVMQATETEVFKYGKNFVAVSQAMVDHFKSKYSITNKKTWIILPIFNGTSGERKTKKVYKKRNVVYAGGAQSWQNIDKMIDAINNARSEYEFTVLTHSPAAFGGLNKEAKQRTVIKTVSSNQITKYYQVAVLGFILRDDIIVNTVACPTKLIEYLSHGVVPIVLSPNIGDFKEFGYSYIDIGEFLKRGLSSERLEEAIENNYKVYEKFKKLISTGTEELKLLTRRIDKLSNRDEGINEEHLITKLSNQELTDKVIKQEYQISEYKKKINEYADVAKHYQTQLELSENKRFSKRIRMRLKGVTKH